MGNEAETPRIAIVGGGPAGMRAAGLLAAAGLRPVLFNEAPEPGGQIYRRPPPPLRTELSPARLYGPDAGRAMALHSDFEAVADLIDHRSGTLVWNIMKQEHGGFRLLHQDGDGRQGALNCDAVILATGAMDRILPMPGWTLPGVWSMGGAQVMLKGQASLVGRRPVFAGSGPLLYLVAWQYAKAGGRPAAVIDGSTFAAKLRAAPLLAARPTVALRGLAMAAALRLRGIPVIKGAHADRIEATDTGIRVHWSSSTRSGQIDGDAVAIGHGLKSEQQLAELLGCRSRHDTESGQWLIETDPEGRTSVAGVYLAGDMAGIRGGHAAEFAGELAAWALLADLKHRDNASRRAVLRRKLARQDRFRRGLEQAFPFPQHRIASLPDETIVCRCEGISASALRRAITDWQPAEVNRLKAMSRCGMGRCQGRLCGQIAAGLLTAELGRAPGDVGHLRAQAPIKPIPGSQLIVEKGVVE